MEAIVFIGLPSSGKSSFFKERFFHSHIRLNLDLLKTRHREERLLEFCLETQQQFVVDNTNPTRLDRVRYIPAARARQFKVSGYYFQSKIGDCLARNALRSNAERVHEVAILSIAKKLELPMSDEGFDQRFYARLSDTGFAVEEWRDEV